MDTFFIEGRGRAPTLVPSETHVQTHHIDCMYNKICATQINIYYNCDIVDIVDISPILLVIYISGQMVCICSFFSICTM